METEEMMDLGVFGLRLVTPPGVMKPGTDAILLSDFAARRLRPRSRVADLCTGGGIIALLLAARGGSEFVLVDNSPAACDAARENIAVNRLSPGMQVWEGDISSLKFPPQYFDLVTCNPPYFPAGSLVSPENHRRSERNEGEKACSFREVAACAGKILKTGGAFMAVYRPERLVDAFVSLREADLEPKILRFCSYSPDHPPFCFLVEARKGGHPGLILAPPLRMDSEEAKEIYTGRTHWPEFR